MKIKKTVIVTLLLLCLLTIGAVCASENSTDNTVSSDVADDKITTSTTNTGDVRSTIDTTPKKVSNDDEIVLEEYSSTSFKALDKKINDATEGSTIELKQDYNYDESSDSDFEDGITISKSLTIDGKGSTINAKGKARIFNIAPEVSVIIKNLKLSNGYNFEGGAIYTDEHSKVTITNSQFTNNKADWYGGAIYAGYSNIIIDDTEFNNNMAGDVGGAICSIDSKITITNSIFNDNSVGNDGYGGAIYAYESNTSILNTEFINNNANFGGAIYSECGNLIITNSQLNKNTAKSGGAIYYDGNMTILNSQLNNNIADAGGAITAYNICNMNILKTTFTKNTATNYNGGAILAIGTNITIENNTFIRNNAKKGGAIYLDSLIKWVEGHNETKEMIVFDYISGFLVGNHTEYYNLWVEEHYEEIETGATISFGNDFKIINNMFKSNTADDTGKAIQNYVTNTVIKNNINDTTSIYSSTIWVKGTNITITDNRFHDEKIDDSTNQNTPENNNGPNSNNQNTNGGTSANAQSTGTTIAPAKIIKTVKISAAKKTFKRKIKVKKYTVTVKSDKKGVKGLKLTLKIKGKKYTATTNNKGQAIFKIKKLTKKGKYTATITFNGDKTYKKASKKVKINVK